MIRELQIKNLALIENLTLEFDAGFTVFTGETGAGKSILIGAIGLLLGERASSDMIRSGCEEAQVYGTFEIEAVRKKLQNFLDENEISADDGTLIIRRNITKNGKNRIHVNQTPMPLSTLKMLGNLLIDLHGQHEHQSLLNEETHADIIDAMRETKIARENYGASYNKYVAASQEFLKAKNSAKTLADKKDILEFQHKELSALNLQKDEETALEQELALLSSSAQRVECAKDILGLLGTEGEGENVSLQKKLTQIKRKLETLSKYDPSVTQYMNDMETIVATCSELDLFCSKYLENIDDDCAGRIETINSRLSKIQRLKKKYNCSVDELISKTAELAKQLSLLDNTDFELERLRKLAEAAKSECVNQAKELTNARQNVIKVFDKKIMAQMERLGFTGGEWQSQLTPLDEPAPCGMETIRFLVKTNPGEPFLPLAKSASGGEVSRLMLAIKSIVADADDIPVLIFDEIDTGIGGVLAHEVSKALYALSSTHQVLCISHLHQIAAVADNHYVVSKKTVNDRTITEVCRLDDEERKFEIARMLGGESDVSLKHAEQLLGAR